MWGYILRVLLSSVFLAGWILPTEHRKYLIIATFAEPSDVCDFRICHPVQFRYGRYAVAGERKDGAVAEDS